MYDTLFSNTILGNNNQGFLHSNFCAESNLESLDSEEIRGLIQTSIFI